MKLNNTNSSFVGSQILATLKTSEILQSSSFLQKQLSQDRSKPIWRINQPKSVSRLLDISHNQSSTSINHRVPSHQKENTVNPLIPNRLLQTINPDLLMPILKTSHLFEEMSNTIRRETG